MNEQGPEPIPKEISQFQPCNGHAPSILFLSSPQSSLLGGRGTEGADASPLTCEPSAAPALVASHMHGRICAQFSQLAPRRAEARELTYSGLAVARLYSATPWVRARGILEKLEADIVKCSVQKKKLEKHEVEERRSWKETRSYEKLIVTDRPRLPIHGFLSGRFLKREFSWRRFPISFFPSFSLFPLRFKLLRNTLLYFTTLSGVRKEVSWRLSHSLVTHFLYITMQDFQHALHYVRVCTCNYVSSSVRTVRNHHVKIFM